MSCPTGVPSSGRLSSVRPPIGLWAVQQHLAQRGTGLLTAGDPLGHVQSRPVQAGPFAHALHGQHFAGAAAFVKDPVIGQTFYRFPSVSCSRRDGILEAAVLAYATVAETEMVRQ